MANEKLLAIVTILSLIGTAAQTQEDITIQDLRTIDALVTGKDWRALYVYVNANPKLTAGDDPLAVELRNFVDETKRGLLNRFATDPDERSGGDSQDPQPSGPSIY